MKLIPKVSERPYPIIIGNQFDILKQQIAKSMNPSCIIIITDTNVGPRYLETIKSLFQDQMVLEYTFAAGECSKQLDTVNEIYQYLIANEVDRKALIIALGGGVVGDLAGFVASTYLRGIDFIQVPTTILAQNDSSIGGKVGVDYSEYKNMIGAFHNPKLVYTNIQTLKTLPEQEYITGMAEVIKHAMIRDPQLYTYLKENREAILKGEEEALIEMTYQSNLVKCHVVEEDLKEQGIRQILNFGHTIGHALEAYFKFSLSHGACVAYGCVAAAWLSTKRNLLPLDVLEDMIQLFKDYGLLKPLQAFDGSVIYDEMLYDKKRTYGKIAFILLEGMGKTIIVKDITKEEILGALEFIQETCR